MPSKLFLGLESLAEKEQKLREDESRRWWGLSKPCFSSLRSGTVTDLNSKLAQLRSELDSSIKDAEAKIQELQADLRSCRAQRDQASASHEAPTSKQNALLIAF